MSSSNNIELEEIPSESHSKDSVNDQGQGTTNYVINPTYCSYDDEKGHNKEELEDSVRDPTSNDKMYEIVPGEKSSSPPPPSTPPPPPSLAVITTRKTTPNNLYVSRGQILHPISTIERNKATKVETSDEEDEIKSYKYTRLTCLLILVVASLFLAIVAVVLVLLLWLGIYAPNGCHSLCSTSAAPQPEGIITVAGLNAIPTSSSTLSPTPSLSSAVCVCPTPDVLSIVSEIEEKSSNITELIKEIIQLQIQSNATDQSLLGQSNYISSQVSEINSTCHETLVNLTSQNVSLAGLEFNAELRNVGLYSNCIYEYLSNCTMDISTFECDTSYHKVLVEGYYNLNLGCQIFVEAVPNAYGGAVAYPIATLITREQNDGDNPQGAVLNNLEVRCDCHLIKESNNTRNNIVTCILHRFRCPFVSTLQNVVIKTK